VHPSFSAAFRRGLAAPLADAVDANMPRSPNQVLSPYWPSRLRPGCWRILERVFAAGDALMTDSPSCPFAGKSGQ